MKKILVMILFSISLLFGQITLEHTYSNAQIYFVRLKNSGEKYYLVDKSIPAVKVYNLDHSIYKTMNIPVAYDGYTPQNAYIVTEGLFTADNKLGALVTYSNSSNDYKSRVIADGTPPQELISISNCNYGSAVQTAIGAKLITNEYVISGSTVIYSSHVYALPGSLPVSVSESFNNVPERIEIGQSYPNPVNGAITIPYELPNGENEGTMTVYNALGQEVLNLRVDRNFSDIKLSSDRLSAGTYIYNLKTGNKISEPKRFTVTK